MLVDLKRFRSESKVQEMELSFHGKGEVSEKHLKLPIEDTGLFIRGCIGRRHLKTNSRKRVFGNISP